MQPEAILNSEILNSEELLQISWAESEWFLAWETLAQLILGENKLDKSNQNKYD